MRVLSEDVTGPGPWPTVDQLSFRSLYTKTQYAVETADGWSLKVTRYRPRPQPFEQPLWGEPLLLVHGFSQNRHAWTSGEFVKNLLYFGVDCHVLELRGHGKSSLALQHERAARFKRPLPADLDYGWDLDSHFLYDLPAAVAAVKRITRRPRIFYCGHSLGGMLGYGYAGIHDDFDGLITIGAPSDLGKGVPLLKLLALWAPALGAAVDLAFSTMSAERRLAHLAAMGLARARRWVRKAEQAAAELPPPTPLRFQYVPLDDWLKWAERQLAEAQERDLYNLVARRLMRLSNPQRVSTDDIRWLLREGGEKEPRGVIEELARWIRNGEMVCYRTGYDFKRGFSKIKIPMAIIFGDMDPLASVESTRSVYRAAKSDYLLWRPVKGNSHVELTMGHDIRQICYDVKNLIEYARTRRTQGPSLPRVR